MGRGDVRAIAIVSLLHLALSYRFLPEEEVPYKVPSYSSSNKRDRSITDVPYHVLVVYSTFYCSGSLIASKVVVTAASCFNKYNADQNQIFVKVGVDYISGRGQIIQVSELKRHEYFDHLNDVDNDISLLLLEDHVVFGPNVKKVIIVEAETVLRVGITISVTGFESQTAATKYTNTLIRSEMAVMDREECKQMLNRPLAKSSFCAKYQADHTLSDNGGPAVYKDLLVGILSIGANNKENPYIATITNVSFFNRWISLNTKRLLRKNCLIKEDRSIPLDSYEYRST